MLDGGLYASATVELAFGIALMVIPYQVFTKSPVFRPPAPPPVTLGSHGAIAAREQPAKSNFW